MIEILSCGLLAQDAGYNDDYIELSILLNKDLKHRKCDGRGYSKAECNRIMKRYADRKIIPLVVDDLAQLEGLKPRGMGLKSYAEIQYARRCNFVR